MRVLTTLTLTLGLVAAKVHRSTEDFCAGNLACPRNYSPVCGNDGKTYANECTFKVAKCDRAALEIIANSSCDDVVEQDERRQLTADCPEACLEILSPVCGSDGKTYGNECSLQRATCNQGVRVAYSGECTKSHRELTELCPDACIEVLDPVCGTDGKTYDNECFMNMIACRKNIHVTVDYHDECDGRTKKVAHSRPHDATSKCVVGCHEIFQPVCGSDGHTYENECTLHRDACLKNVKITVVRQGDCEGQWPL
ncbi:Aste57867_23185 [Aphanomyces stellatus]|uniref:Aste57867_23185 protein n=1 Tax=Aphanomyces stellatus TaxID=120398 RepID=A0A485LM75_9STRA|nr:hypothetical protein As57867_023114 [Aphanomyces stellatus]VFT99832.1 Aste57867_23185 [Aphanomyces stellatus]